jgi:hypothetical protein
MQKRGRDFTGKEPCWPPQGKETLLYADRGLYPLGMQSLVLKFSQKEILEGALTCDHSNQGSNQRNSADILQTTPRLAVD